MTLEALGIRSSRRATAEALTVGVFGGFGGFGGFTRDVITRHTDALHDIGITGGGTVDRRSCSQRERAKTNLRCNSK